MFEREATNNSTLTRSRICSLPLQISILLIWFLFLFVVHMSYSSDEGFGQQLEDRLHPQRLRHIPLAVSSHVDYQKKRDVIEDLRKMYEGETLDRANVHEILRDGTELLSKVDTIYDIAMPKIELEEDAQASKKSITVSRRFQCYCPLQTTSIVT